MSIADLEQCGCSTDEAGLLSRQIERWLNQLSPDACWNKVAHEALSPKIPFAAHRLIFQSLYAEWNVARNGPPPAWLPSHHELTTSNIARVMEEQGFKTYADFHQWARENRGEFWNLMISRLGIRFEKPYTKIVDLAGGVAAPRWLPGARLNIADSCFQSGESETAIIFQAEGGTLSTMSYGELNRLANRVANSLLQAGFRPGDTIAVDMVMTAEAVAVYLGIIKLGCVVIGVADSFAPAEIATRLRIAMAKAIFTQDVIVRAGKRLPMYEKVTRAHAPKAIVLSGGGSGISVKLRERDITWDEFLVQNDLFASRSCDPHDSTNILFSSGTTGDPKAILWSHTTPIKSAVDAYLHQDIQPGDVLAWPTSLGWMMGPWLIYSALVNRATIALYYGVPTGRPFAKFVQDAKVTMLGVVPSLVKAWRMGDATEGLDWSGVKIFSSTGECSNAEDMLWLMSTAGYKPVIEYCGGTEIGGAFIAGTIVQPASPATFTTPTLGLDLIILDQQGTVADQGEIFIVPPSIGLSVEMLTPGHDAVYYADTPRGPQGEILRRHGDQMERLAGGFFRAHGRADDTMNLGGIKAGSAEIERVLNTVPGVLETAAIAVPPEGGGPSLLVVYAVMQTDRPFNKIELLKLMQQALKERLNPLFKIYDLVQVQALPRTDSNKVMRRVLRAQFTSLPEADRCRQLD